MTFWIHDRNKVNKNKQVYATATLYCLATKLPTKGNYQFNCICPWKFQDGSFIEVMDQFSGFHMSELMDLGLV